MRRHADFIIGKEDSPYLLRWWIIPRNRWFNIYLHKIVRSDDDRALHDHPWWNCSIILKGGYQEVMPSKIRWRAPGSITFRPAKAAHRLILHGHCCWSLFITGPKFREWGFHCPNGWRPWQVFVSTDDGPGNPGRAGRGCG